MELIGPNLTAPRDGCERTEFSQGLGVPMSKPLGNGFQLEWKQEIGCSNWGNGGSAPNI